ncbi:AAR021Wp [Eremothecium gossypii ATCC 10895]|uniref:Protoporphyrinogen oxidase n=1 Tax=Eremothecium gossypii (strain ATCC 10895 / CBS 109.51 / FGSC 9923 / NRRL Y-1056) TaxID=284811 RepID=Q75EQ8_EREGS|nr:AAR021Wp [Eremothecium gossypii ATCC 10895]AAS50386.2 AAR021Wp [Eremothecium gossypii ATCC 10895]AEY94672.1 FAAR021Wp [Eremothecium gossypii FDAG1]
MPVPASVLQAGSKVLVVGGGIGGLSYAYFLSRLRPDIKVKLLETRQNCRGSIVSKPTSLPDGSVVNLEKGPRTLRGVSDSAVIIMDLVRQLGESQSIYGIAKDSPANRKFLLDHKGELLQLPNSWKTFRKFMQNPLSDGLVRGILGEPFRRTRPESSADESAFDLFVRRFGNAQVPNNLLSSLFHGIYGDDIQLLSAQRIARRFYEMEQEHSSFIRAGISGIFKKPALSLSLDKYQETFGRDKEELLQLKKTLSQFPILGFKGGMEFLPRLILKELSGMPNVEICTGKLVSAVSPAKDGKIEVVAKDGTRYTGIDHVRLAVSPMSIKRMLSEQSISSHLERASANTIAVVNFYLPKKDVIADYHSFGYLAPISIPNPHKLLGVIFDSVVERSYTPLFAPSTDRFAQGQYTKMTAMMGGHYFSQQDLQNPPSEDGIIQNIKNVFKRHLHISEADLAAAHWSVTLAKNCIPHFHVGYNQWETVLRGKIQSEYGHRISLGGMAFSSGPGVPDVFMNGFLDAVSMAK